MSFSTTTIFSVPHGTNCIGSANAPAGYFSSWSQSVSGNAGTNAFPMYLTVSNVALGGQVSSQNTFSAITSGSGPTDLGMAQFISPPLVGQSVSSSSVWQIYMGFQITNASATFTWTPRAALYLVNGSGVGVGTIKTTIIALTNVGATGRSSTNELGCGSASLSGSAFTAASGDYLVLECGVSMTNTSGGSLSPNVTIFGAGVNNAVDNATNTNPSTGIVSPTSLNFYPIVNRSQMAAPQIEQPRSPGLVRTQAPMPQIEQPRSPGLVRTQAPMPQIEQPRNGDDDLYLMRAFDSSLSRIVYWVAPALDSSGSMYNGDASKLTDIVSVTLLSTTNS